MVWLTVCSDWHGKASMRHITRPLWGKPNSGFFWKITSDRESPLIPPTHQHLRNAVHQHFWKNRLFPITHAQVTQGYLQFGKCIKIINKIVEYISIFYDPIIWIHFRHMGKALFYYMISVCVTLLQVLPRDLLYTSNIKMEVTIAMPLSLHNSNIFQYRPLYVSLP